MTISEEQMTRIRLKIKLRPFADMVKLSYGFAYQLPDELIDSIPEGLEHLAMEILEQELRLTRQSDGYYAAR